MSRAAITCHILDSVKGRPADNVQCSLERLDGASIKLIATGKTDKDGRILQWNSELTDVVSSEGKVKPGVYKIKFETGEYLSRSNVGEAFFPFVEVVFRASDPPEEHYHVPLLLSNYSYSTYRGS